MSKHLTGKMLLAINTASSNTEIALCEGNNLIAEKNWRAANNEAELLMPEIDKMLRENGKDFSSLTAVLSVRGPGSFTGLRVGVTVVNTLAYLGKIPAYSLTTFEKWWLSSSAPENTALLVYAGSGGVYFSREKKHGELVNLPDLAEKLRSEKITHIFGDISEEQKKVLEDFKWLPTQKSFGKVVANLDLSTQTPAREGIIEPLYIKAPGITQSKKSLLD